MSIEDQITRLNNAKAAIKTSIENKGVDVSDTALLDEYPALIDSIEGGADPYYENLYNLRTKNGTNMASLFSYCAGDLDLSSLDVSKVTDMKYMFSNCSSNVNIDGWNTGKVSNINYMFHYFTGSIDLSKFDFSSVTDATYVFSYTNTDKINLTGLSFPKATSLPYMFSSATGTTLDLSSWDINNITNMNNMFSGKFTRIDLTGWNTSRVTNMSGMFYQYNNPLIELIIPDWDMAKASNANIFGNTSYIANLMLIDLSRSNDATITKIASYLPTRTLATSGKVLIPVESAQTAIDALIAKYWKPVGPKLDLISCEVLPELDEIFPGKSTKLYFNNKEPWYGDDRPEIIEYVSSDESVATIEGDIITSTGIEGTTEITVRNIETQEVISVAPITLSVSETDNYPNVIKFRGTSTPTSNNYIKVNGTNVKLSAMNYNSASGIYTYDVGEPITRIQFNGYDSVSYANTCTDVVKINTSNVTSMEKMFYYCYNLTSLDVSSFNTSKVTTMANMFYGCNNLTTLDLSNFNTSNVTTMYSMFSGCNSLTTLDLSNFNTSNVTTMNSMFYGCNNLTTLDLSNFDMSKTTGVGTGGIFSSCVKLHTLKLDNCSNATISKIIKSYEFPTNAIKGVTRKIYCKESEAAGLTAPKNWIFEYVAEEPEIPLYQPGEFKSNSEIAEVTTMVNESHTDLSNMFDCFYNLRTINNISDWDTSNVTTMMRMFACCGNLTSLDLSNWNVSNVTHMGAMFYGCYNLTSLDLSNWDTSSVTEIRYMFRDCASLHTLRLDNCSNDTINKIITSSYFPARTIEGVTRKIYCKEANAAGLTAPKNWVFKYID